MKTQSDSNGSHLADSGENRRLRHEVSAMSADGEPTLPAALEKLVSATQGVIGKRIDLVMLEVNDLVGTLVAQGALFGLAVLVAIAAWLSGVSAIVLYLAPNYGTAMQLTIFSLINATATGVLIAFAMREARPRRVADPQSDGEARVDSGAFESTRKGSHGFK